MKKVLGFLDGWKTWIVALVLGLQAIFGIKIPMLDAALGALGWSPSDLAFDPGQFAAAIVFLWALGSRLVKAIQQFGASSSVQGLLSHEGYAQHALALNLGIPWWKLLLAGLFRILTAGHDAGLFPEKSGGPEIGGPTINGPR